MRVVAGAITPGDLIELDHVWLADSEKGELGPEVLHSVSFTS